MEKFRLSFVLFICFLSVFESCCDKDIRDDEIMPTIENKKVRTDKELLVDAFIFVESSGDSLVVNNIGATGCLQLMPIMVEEANRLLGYEEFSLLDRLSMSRSKEIFFVIMDFKNPSYDISKACRIWNPRASSWYEERVRNKFEELSLE